MYSRSAHFSSVPWKMGLCMSAVLLLLRGSAWHPKAMWLRF